MIRKKVKKYFELTKPKVTVLNLLVGVTCFVLAAFPSVNWFKLIMFSAIGYLAAGGCGVLNSVYDQDIDRLMLRTSKRAIPSGYATVNKAVALGIAMMATSLGLSFYFFNTLTCLMIALGAVFYLLIYTVWLKRTSSWNVVIGGFAGCFAGLSGWTAVANSISLLPLLVAMVDLLWTPGHLWGLAVKKVAEYKSVGIPMLPVKTGIRRASQTIFLLNVVTVSFTFLLPLMHLTGMTFLIVAAAAGAFFLFQNRGLLFSASEKQGFRVFIASIPYLTCLMLGLIADKFFLL